MNTVHPTMNVEPDYTLCNLDTHHGYTGAYSAAATADLYGFHVNGGYYSDASLSPQLGTAGELPLSSSQQQLSGYASTLLGGRGSTVRGAPTSHSHHAPHHQGYAHPGLQGHSTTPTGSADALTQHLTATSGASTNTSGSVYTGSHSHSHSHHDLNSLTPPMTATDVYGSSPHQVGSAHHVTSHHVTSHHASLSNTPNFLDISGMRTAYPSASALHADASGNKFGSSSPALVGSMGVAGAYLQGAPPTSSPLKSENCTSQQGMQGKPFRWMTIKRNPTKPGESTWLFVCFWCFFVCLSL